MAGTSTLLALGALASVLAGQLAPPPGRIIFRTATFGDVVIPHAKHLERRVTCRNCHGGTIRKVERPGKERGHEICRGCHAEQDRGPLKCLACHVMKRVTPDANPAAPGATRIR